MRIKKLFFIPVFALIFGTFGVVDVAYSRVGDPEICFTLADVADPSENSGDYAFVDPYTTVVFSYGSVGVTGVCSDTNHEGAGNIGFASQTPGEFCWCHIDSVDTDGDIAWNGSPVMVGAYTYSDATECRQYCSEYCGEALANDRDQIRSNLYIDGAAQFCVAGCTTLADLDPDTNFADIGEFGGVDDSMAPNWISDFGSRQIYGTSLCSADPGEYGDSGEPDETTVGSNCWCRVTSYYNGDIDRRYYASSSPWFSTETDFGDPATCEAECARACGEDFITVSAVLEHIGSGEFCMSTPYIYYTLSYSCNGGTGNAPTSQIVQNGQTFTTSANTCSKTGYNFAGWTYSSDGSGTVLNANASATYNYSTNNVLYAKWTPINYTVSFSPGSAGGNTPTGSTTTISNQHVGDTVMLQPSGYTPPSGYMFNGWSCDNSVGNVSGGGTFTMPAANVTCTAQWTQITYPFTLTTTSLTASDRTFTFDISAAGTFYIDCGSGGTLYLEGPNESNIPSNTITKNSATVETYSCRYSSNGQKTIRFGGLATGYNNPNNNNNNAIYPAISFQGNTKVASISGYLSQIFPYLGSADGQIPRFNGTFSGCTSLTSISSTLFSTLTGSGSSMFSDTFNGCTGLTSIPSGLFNFNSNNVSGASGMFSHTFSGCTGLRGANAIPSGLFARVTSSAQGMFYGTFAGCTRLTSLPSDLFNFGGTAVAGAHTLFAETFSGCSGLTSLPSGLFGSFSSGGTSMFLATFSYCTGLESLPNNLFTFTTNITGAQYLFAQTFSNCSSLDSIPSDLFSFGNHTSTGADGMFEFTFSGCTGLATLPDTLFSRITSGAANMFNGTFSNCTGLISIPGTLFNFNNSNSVTGQSSMFNRTFYGCTGLTGLPGGLFARITSSASTMFQQTFGNCTGLTGYIPSDFFAGLTANNHPYTTDMMEGLFQNTGGLATTTTGCPTGTQTYTTGYESYWTDSTNNINSPNHYVACETLSSFTITYYDTDCSTVLTGMTVPTYTTSDNVTLPTPTKSGYTFNTANDKKWCTACGSGCGVGGWNAGTQTGNKNLYVAQWTPNNITVNFDSDANSCNYGGTLNVPTPATRPGYVFTGWKQCRLNDFSANASTDGMEYGYIDGNGVGSYHTDVYNLTQTGTWATKFSYATFWGEARCSSTPGASQGATGTPSATSGEHCWCGITRYEVPGLQSACSLSSVKWLYNTDTGTHEDCTNVCADGCGYLFQISSTVRAAAFSQ